MLLRDLGEFALLESDIFSDIWSGDAAYFNDCADIPARQAGRFLLSTDPCPTPLVEFFQGFNPYTLGWLTATINLSDIAACGGHPNYFLCSLEAPDTASAAEVRAFMQGLRDNLKRFGCRVVGGNLKASGGWRAVGTIIGSVDPEPLYRTPLRAGDEIYLIGPIGIFWAAVLSRSFQSRAAANLDTQLLDKALLLPEPLIDAGNLIKEISGEIRCLDCSDGLATSLALMARIGRVDISVDENISDSVPENIRDIYEKCGFSVLNGVMGFGDWQLLCFVQRSLSSKFEKRLCEAGYSLTRVGQVAEGVGKVRSTGGGLLNPAILNENFLKGYNSIGSLDQMLERFLRPPVFV